MKTARRICLGLALAFTAPLTAAEPSNIPREDFWYPDGAVHTILVTNGLVYLGGNFTSLNRPNAPTSGGFGQFSGSFDPRFPAINGAIHAIQNDGHGGWFVGGQFTQVGDLPRQNLVHIRADRVVDPGWQADADAVVLALALSENTLYVGGSFTTIGGRARSNIAALHAPDGEVTEWDPNAAVSVIKPKPIGVRALVVARGLVYVGGAFTSIGGQDRENLAALDPVTGKATDWVPISFTFPESGQVIDALAVTDDAVYVGGAFIKSINAVPRNFAAAFDATRATNNLLPWNPNASGPVLALAASCDAIYLGGTFLSAGGQPRRNLAAVDPVAGFATSWNPDANGTVLSLTLAGNTLYAGGRFTQIGGQRRLNLAGIDVASGRASAWQPEASFSVEGLAISGGTVFAGGQPFSLARRNLASLDARTGKPTAWNPDPDGAVYGFAIRDDQLYVGGDFQNIAGQPRNHLAAVNTLTGQPMSWNPDVNGFERTNAVVESVVASGNTVYVSGSFTNIGTQPRLHLAALNASTGQLLAWNPAANDDVRALRLAGDTIYVGGRFTQIGGQSRRRIAAVLVSNGDVTGWNPIANDSVRYLALLGDAVLAGGLFSNIGGAEAGRLAALDPSTGINSGWNPNAENTNVIGALPRASYVNALEPSGNTVYVAGLFNRIGGQPRANLAAVDPVTGAAQSWNPRMDAPVIALGVSSNTIFAGGLFMDVSGQFQPHLAVFPPEGSPRITRQPHSQLINVGESFSFEAEATGVAPLSYQWQLNGTNVPGANSSTLLVPSGQVSHAGEYSLVVTNALGLINSRPVSLTVVLPLHILAQPVSQTNVPGSTVSLNIVVSGEPTPVFQWRRNGVNIPGAIQSTLTISNAQPTDGGSYEVVVVNLELAVSSDVATVIITSPELPFADAFGARPVIATGAGLGSGNNLGATNEAGEPNHATVRGNSSVWLDWVAPSNGIATFSTLGSTFDTLLAVYTGTNVTRLTPIAADDDRAGFYGSAASFNAVAGRVYSIAVDGFSGATGHIVLGWSLDTSTAEFPRILMQPLSRVVAAGQSVRFDVGVSSSPTPVTYQWFLGCKAIVGATNAALTKASVQPADVGSYRVIVMNASTRVAESLVAVLEIGASGVLSRDKAEDLESTGSPAPSPLLPAGTSPGLISVSVGTLGLQLFNNLGASNQLGEPHHCGVLGGSSRYLDLHAQEGGVLVIDTIGSQIDTVLAVYYRTNLSALLSSLVACDNNSAPDGIRSVARFNAKSGRDYRAYVDGVNAAQGVVKFNWKMGMPPMVQPGPLLLLTNRVGSGVTLSAPIVGLFPATSFQWLLNGLAIARATNEVLNIENLGITGGGAYSVITCNDFGCTTNLLAVITVEIPLTAETGLGHGTVRLSIQGVAGDSLFLETSPDLVRWIPFSTNRVGSGPLVLDVTTTNGAFKFFRAKPLIP